MGLFLPFKRAGAHEKAIQVVVFGAAVMGAIAMLVPIAMLVALSFGDATDAVAYRKWPSLVHLTSPKRLYIRYLAVRYDYWPIMTGFDDLYGLTMGGSDEISRLKEVASPTGNWKVRALDAVDFVRTKLPWTHTQPLFTGWYYFVASYSHNLSAYTGLGEELWKSHLKRKYGTIRKVNEEFGSEAASFAYIKVPGLPDLNSRSAGAATDPYVREFIGFLNESFPAEWKLPHLGDRWWRAWLKSLPETGGDLARLNTYLGTAYRSWTDVHVPSAAPAGGTIRTLWEGYVRKVASPYALKLQVTPALEGSFRQFLVVRHGSEDGVAANYGTVSSGVPLPATPHSIPTSTAFQDWDAFARTVPADAVFLNTTESMWREHLMAKYPDISALNSAWGTALASFDDVPWPQLEVDRLDWDNHRISYISEILFGSYRRVWELLTSASSALWNTARFTIIFTVLAVAVNAGAAWVLSRFQMGPLQLSLVFFLAIAAFPIEAIAVPSFLLLRTFGLLNSVLALVLPTALNGYWIYLLKSHFDSIPKSHMEEAMLQTTSEWQLFTRVALPMARPMLSVVALYAFLWSYSNFMWAFIVCQQREQWTVPVLLFSMNQWTPTPVLAAGAVLALVPPLIVFAFAHRTLQSSLTLPKV